MEESNSVFVIIIACCVIMSAYFSATETAFSSLNRIRLKNMIDKGNEKAQKVLDMYDNYDSLLSTILIGNNIVNIACASLSTIVFSKLLGQEMGAGVSTVVITIVVLIFGEVTPKSIAKESPEQFAMFASPLLGVLMVLLAPFNYLFKLWKKLLSKIIHPGVKQSITEEELLTFVEETKNEGGIDEQESTMIRNVIDFSDLEALDILKPRIDVIGVSTKASKEEIARVFLETKYSRLPIYEESLDHIIGIIYQKDFHNYVAHTDEKLSKIIKPAIFVLGNKKIRDLLKELQAKKSHMAIVIDEHGGTIGIVTMEDILEELVGEIWDEHDEIIYDMEKISDSEYIVLGTANIEKIFQQLGIEEEFDVITVNGWIMENLHHVPTKGDCFKYERLKIEVIEIDGKRVSKVRIKILPHHEEA